MLSKQHIVELLRGRSDTKCRCYKMSTILQNIEPDIMSIFFSAQSGCFFLVTNIPYLLMFDAHLEPSSLVIECLIRPKATFCHSALCRYRKIRLFVVQHFVVQHFVVQHFVVQHFVVQHFVVRHFVVRHFVV
jgi:hypothetical protein